MRLTLQILIFTSLLLAGCGWHFQGGAASEKTTLTTLSLTADNVYTELYRSFKFEYERRGIELKNDINTPALKLHEEVVTSRVLSLNTELDPAEDEITLTIRFSIILPEQAPIVRDIQFHKIRTRNKNRAASLNNETNILLNEMRREAAEKILNQIYLLTNAPNATPTP